MLDRILENVDRKLAYKCRKRFLEKILKHCNVIVTPFFLNNVNFYKETL